MINYWDKVKYLYGTDLKSKTLKYSDTAYSETQHKLLIQVVWILKDFSPGLYPNNSKV